MPKRSTLSMGHRPTIEQQGKDGRWGRAVKRVAVVARNQAQRSDRCHSKADRLPQDRNRWSGNRYKAAAAGAGGGDARQPVCTGEICW